MCRIIFKRSWNDKEHKEQLPPFIFQSKTLRVGFQDVSLTSSPHLGFLCVCAGLDEGLGIYVCTICACACLDEGIGIYACTHLCVERCTHVQQM